MKFLSVVALLALASSTVVLSQDSDVTAAPECDCSSQIQAHLDELVAQGEVLSASLETVQSEHETIAAKVTDCAASLKTPKTSSRGETALEEFRKQVTQYDENLTAEFDEKKEELREITVAIKIFKEREEESRKDLTSLFEEYQERKDEFNKYILEHQVNTEELYKEIIAEMAKPGPLVNFARMRDDAKTFFKSLVNPKKEKDVEEPVEAETTPSETTPEGGESTVG